MSAVVNPVRIWLRLEAMAVFVAGLLVWIAMNGGWPKFALGFLLPDLALLAYLVGPRAGAAVYNLTHSYVIPAVLAVIGASLDQTSLLLAGALWTSHIGFDRMLGLGLKYPTGFADTHLGQLHGLKRRVDARAS